jgi:Zn-dependent M28 family amino/carboxypeptidase
MTMGMSPRGRRLRVGAIAGLALAGAMVPVTATAKPALNGCERRVNNHYDKLLECVRVEGVLEHLAAFQAIADRNGGNRSEGTTGYTESVEYVVATMQEAGWEVERVPFTYPGADNLLRIEPDGPSFPAIDAEGTAEGEVVGPAVLVDVNLEGDRQNSSGCEPSDFAGFPAGAIAVLQRGTCPFADKALNAEAAGAAGVVLFNQGDTIGAGDRFGPLNPTLGGPDVVDIPVVGTSFDAGVALGEAAGDVRLRVAFVDIESENVIAELPGRNDDNVVMAGAHLDSVPAGPGINDNGSGSAVLLEVAQQLGRVRPENTVRFAWWGAEELGLEGSTAWVGDQPAAELDRIALYMNFDMVGSPNYVFMVYDANESSFAAPVPVPPGSEAIEATFESFYTLAGVPYDDTEFSGRSDYQAFIANGIPSSGLFTGAEVVKTPLQASIWGGTAGAQFDPCYHAECDRLGNVDEAALAVNADAVAFAVLTYAYSTESVNGVPGRRIPGNFPIPEPAGPQHTFAGPLGGDHHDVHSAVEAS